MPKRAMSKKRSFKTRKGTTRRVDALGTSLANSVVVPRSLQTRSVHYLRGLDVFKGHGLGSGLADVTFNSGTYVKFISNWLTSCANWSAVTTENDEFQPIALRIKYEPEKKYINNFPSQVLFFDVDGNATGGPAIGGVLAAYRTGKLVNLADSWEIEYQIPLDAKDQWYDITNPGAWRAQIGIGSQISMDYADLPVNNYFGSLMFEVVCRFRGVQ